MLDERACCQRQPSGPVGIVKLPPKPARVVLVDDHPDLLRQTCLLLEGEFEIVQTLHDGSRLAAVVAQFQPDLILLDIALPGINGIELATRLLADGCAAKIVFLTVHEDPDYARAAFAAGGVGYVIKSRLASDLLRALEAVLDGRTFISPTAGLSGVL